MSDATPLLRQWMLLRMFSARRNGVTLREMAAEADCSQKTIRRDLQALQQVGFPLSETSSDHGRKHWKLAVENGEPVLSFNLTEVLSLYLGRMFLEPLAGTYLWDGAQSAFRKLRASLSEQALRHLNQLQPAFVQTTFGAGDCTHRAEIVDALLVAIEDSRTARILYHSSHLDLPASYDVQPYGLIHHRGSLYLVAFAPQHSELRHYKVDRIRDAEVLRSVPFVRPANFDLQNHLRGTLGVFHKDHPPTTVRIRFLNDAARYVREHRWHSTQRLTQNDDGSTTLEMDLSDLTEVKSWVLGFGAKAVVEEPNQLREDILTEARTLISHLETVT